MHITSIDMNFNWGMCDSVARVRRGLGLKTQRLLVCTLRNGMTALLFSTACTGTSSPPPLRLQCWTLMKCIVSRRLSLPWMYMYILVLEICEIGSFNFLLSLQTIVKDVVSGMLLFWIYAMCNIMLAWTPLDGFRTLTQECSTASRFRPKWRSNCTLTRTWESKVLDMHHEHFLTQH